jgi:uncharacterized phage protein (TIGR01671 family)
MREILFRGKTTEGKWVQGSLQIGYGWRIIEGKRQIDHRICDLNNKCDNVIPETVGQYTGLTDMYGERIFEGDIIKQECALNGYERPIRSVIEYGIGYAKSNACGICQRFSDGSGISLLSVANERGVVYCEVIGNIHDNPELLKGGAE